MSSKRKSDVIENVKKRSRQGVSLEVKLAVIKRSEKGERPADIARHHSLPPTTVRSIIKDAEKYKGYAKEAISATETKAIRGRDNLMVKLERLLTAWIEDQTQRRMPLSTMLIQEKALTLFNDIKIEFGESSASKSFNASSGWFERFKTRSGIHNVKCLGEAASADTDAALGYPELFKQIITEGGYSPKQVFNVDETGLFWKKMPERSFIAQEEKCMPGYKTAKDRLTLLLGGNAAGDLKLKPMLVYRSLNPRALKGYLKARLPVFWKANRKAWVTQTVFQEWFIEYFFPTVTKYLKENNLADKALLILDNAPGHPKGLEDLSDGKIKLIFLPPNTTALIQPMDQGVIANFKRYYLRRTFSKAIRETEGDGALTLKEFWRDFNILKAVNLIGEAWDEVSSHCMNSVWKKLWPECSTEFIGSEETPEQIQADIVQLGQQLGFDELEEIDIEELIASHNVALTNEELIQLDEIRGDEEEEDGTDNSQLKCLKTKDLETIFKHLQTIKQILELNDPNIERSGKVNRNLENCIKCYRELYAEKRKAIIQPSLDKFFISNKDVASKSTA